jgi:LmbE family N-acetylglucosaminyl deacetylase
MKTILGIFAHPDDESFTSAGTIAKYVKAGWKVDLVCATHGEAGQWGPIEHGEHNSLAAVRQKELEAAAAELGVHSVTFMDFKDGKLDTTTPGDLEDKLTQIMIVHKPDVVITFDTTGISNHPDHVRISLGATFAFQTYAKLRRREKPTDENPPKLYFACMPENVAIYLKKQDVIPAESYGKPWRGVEDKIVSTVIDIKRQKAVKKKALRAHISQEEDVSRFLSLDSNPLLSQEYFILRMVGVTEAFMGKNDAVSDRL